MKWINFRKNKKNHKFLFHEQNPKLKKTKIKVEIKTEIKPPKKEKVKTRKRKRKFISMK